MDYAYPIPQFLGKKCGKPEGYWLKVENWLAHFHVADDAKIDSSRKPFMVDLGCGFIPSLILIILMEITLLH